MTVRIHWRALAATLLAALTLAGLLALLDTAPVIQIRHTGHVGLWL